MNRLASTRLTILSLIVLGCAGGAAEAAPPRPVTTPLADANLFISPSGMAYRSKPGEPYPVTAWFKVTDTNHDGKIDRAEFKAEAAAFFHILDLRKNGVIDDEIISLYEKKVVPEILQANVGQTQAAVPTDGSSTYSAPSAYKTSRQGAAVFGLLNDGEPLRSADRSFRGLIRLPDVLAQADRNFDALDVDQKGYLTLEDLPHTPAEDVATPLKKK